MFLADLQAKTPHMGLGASDGHFVDHLVSLAGRYGSHLFICFDDPRVPPTTNELEGFFGEFKSFVKRTTGRGSTANGLAQSLGAELLVVFHEARHRAMPREPRPIDAEAFRRTRVAMAEDEAPARRRRSLVRNLHDNLERLMDRWRATRALAATPGRADRPSALAGTG